MFRQVAQQARSTATPAPGALVQRACACGQHSGNGGECAACRQKRLGLQRQATSQTTPDVAPPLVHDVLRSPGQPLDQATRAFMEPRFGHDFSRVQVHTDARAAESAQAVNALAYTVGSHIAFAAGQHAPRVSAGRRLLAHELAHVVQQGNTAVLQPHPVSSPSGRLEQEASLTAEAIIADKPLPSLSPASSVVQRQDAGADAGVDAGVATPDAGRAAPAAPASPTPASPTPALGLPTATFVRFVTSGRVRCCRAVGPKGCPPHLGAAKSGDPSAKNGMNLVASIAGHRPGVEYGFVQVIHFRQCIRFGAALGGGWSQSDSKGPGADDSPIAEVTCRIPDARNEITMTDAPGLAIALGSNELAGAQEVTHRVNATDWVIAREPPGRWQRISELFGWHSITRIQRNAAGNWELTPGENRIGSGYTRIGGCPPRP